MSSSTIPTISPAAQQRIVDLIAKELGVTAPQIAAAVTLLDERDRHVLRMRFIDEMSQPEIADALGISQSYVSRILRSSLAQLRSTMEETSSPASVPPASSD